MDLIRREPAETPFRVSDALLPLEKTDLVQRPRGYQLSPVVGLGPRPAQHPILVLAGPTSRSRDEARTR